MTRSILPLSLLALSACNGAGSENVTASNAAAGPDAPSSEADLAEDAALANEAAEAEAIDTELYGGNAAAGETGNAQ